MVNYILYGRTMRMVQHLIPLLVFLLLLHPLLLLLIVLYDGVDTYNMMIICMSGAMSYVLSDGNDTNGNTTIYFSSISTAAAVVFAYPWIRCIYRA